MDRSAGRRVHARHNPLANALATLAIGVVQLGMAISLAALIFSDQLASGAGRASAAFVLGTAISSAVVGWFSSMPLTIVGAQDTGAVVLAAVAASMTSATEMDRSSQIPTVLVMIALTAALTGLAFAMIGRRGLTGFVRYLPWPVITGFIAGTGWLLVRGGVEVMRGSPIGIDELGALLDWPTLQRLLPGIALASWIAVVLATRISNTLISVAILVGAVLFHVIGRSVSSAGRLERDGWLVGPFPSDTGWSPIGPDDLRAVDWRALAEHALPISAVIAVSIVGMLLNLSSLESMLDTEIDMDHEIRITGWSNLALAPVGGLIGWHLLGDTVMGRKLGARGRMVPLSIAAMALTVFLAGPELIGLMPRSVAGGVLAGLGLSMLATWVTTTKQRLNRADQLVSVAILASIAVLGVLPGVAIGVVMAALAFIRQSSRLEPARHVLAAAGRSNVDRSDTERAVLDAHPRSVLAVELQGFLFFGSTMRIRSLLELHGLAGDETRFVILDLKRVSGIDSTAATGLATLVGRLRSQGVQTVFSSIGDDIAEELQRNDVMIGEPAVDLDHAIAACEEAVLDTVVDQRHGDGDGVLPEHLAALMDRRSVEAGERLIAAGDRSREIYFVERGRLTAWLTGEDGSPTRIRQVLPGAVLGEIAFAGGGPRTADVIADTDVVVKVLTREVFDDLSERRPELALELLHLLLVRFADRLSSTSTMVRDLLR